MPKVGCVLIFLYHPPRALRVNSQRGTCGALTSFRHLSVRTRYPFYLRETRGSAAVGPHCASCYSRQILRLCFSAKSALFRVYFSKNASAARWGVVQPVGHLTVNEDGEGSNPSAPAKLLLVFSDLRQQARFHHPFSYQVKSVIPRPDPVHLVAAILPSPSSRSRAPSRSAEPNGYNPTASTTNCPSDDSTHVVNLVSAGEGGPAR